MLNNHLKDHVQNTDSIAKEGIRNLLRDGAESLRIVAQVARYCAEKQRQMEAVEEIASTSGVSDEELSELNEAQFKAILLVDSLVLNLLIHQEAALVGFGNSITESTNGLVKAKEMVKLIKEGNLETVSGVIEDLSVEQKSSQDLTNKIMSTLGKEKFEIIRIRAQERNTFYSSEIYA